MRDTDWLIVNLLPFDDLYTENYVTSFYGWLLFGSYSPEMQQGSYAEYIGAVKEGSSGILLAIGGPNVQGTGSNLTDYSTNNRTVDAVVNCEKFLVTVYSMQDTHTSTITFLNTSAGEQQNITWDIPLSMNFLSWSSINETFGGPRSARVLVLQHDEANDYLFDCNSTVPHLTSRSNISPQLDLPDQKAVLFAGAIGWGLNYSVGERMYRDYDPHFDDYRLTGIVGESYSPEDIAGVIRMFTLGALLSYDTYGPKIAVPGNTPTQAQVLKVDWIWVITLLVGIPIIQLLLLIGVTYLSSAAVIKDTSYLSAAYLLKPVVEQLGGHGCILSGKDLADQLGNQPVVYGVRYPKQSCDDTVYHLDIIKQSEAAGSTGFVSWSPGTNMPKGWYDGVEPDYPKSKSWQHGLSSHTHAGASKYGRVKMKLD